MPSQNIADAVYHLGIQCDLTLDDLNIWWRNYYTSSQPEQSTVSQKLSVELSALRSLPKTVTLYLADHLFPKQSHDRSNRSRIKRISTLKSGIYPSSISLDHLYSSTSLQLDLPTVGIIGARNAGLYGLEIVRRLTTLAAKHQITVVSGGARGIDFCAHKTILQQGGQTIIISGSGLCYINHKIKYLLDKYPDQTTVISPFSLIQPPTRWTFPKRNPLIALLSDQVIVCEASISSGSLQAARSALRANKTVWVVPGPIDDPQFKGCHQLVHEGAKLLCSLDQWIVDTLDDSTTEQTHLNHEALIPPISHDIWRLTSAYPISLNKLAKMSKLPVNMVFKSIVELEMLGWIRATPTGLYVRTTPK